MQALQPFAARFAVPPRRPCARRVAGRPRVARCVAEGVSEPARARVQALMTELAGGPASDGASAVRLLQTQLQSAQDALALLTDESSHKIKALQTVAERLSEEKLRADAALAAKSDEQAAALAALAASKAEAAALADASMQKFAHVEAAKADAVAAAAQHARDLAAAQERHDATLHEERARVRAAETLLAELPPPEELAAQQQAATTRLASAVARVTELERELSAVQDTVVSERVEKLVARVRALEAELAEQEGGADEAAALRASATAASQRAAELEAASAAAHADRGAEVERLAAQNKLLEQALRAQRTAAVAPAPAAVLSPAVTDTPQARTYPDDIQAQLRRIEALLESLPASPSALFNMAPVASSAAARAAPPRSTLPPSPGFVRAPPGRFTLRRHLFEQS